MDRGADGGGADRRGAGGPVWLGGVFGVAVLAAVFSRHGVYASPATFADGFAQALWVAAGLSAAGIVAAMLTPGRGRVRAQRPEPALAGA